jgi:segregation and condensation protein B
VLQGQFDRTAIAACEQGILVVSTARPNGSDGVEDELCGKPETWGRLDLTGGAAPQFAACLEQFGTGCAMDRPVDSPSAKERAVCGVYDGIHFERGDVGEDGIEAHAGLDARMHFRFGDCGRNWRICTVHLGDIPRTERIESMSLKSKIEAVIYASEEPVTLAQLAGLLGEEAQAEMDAERARQSSLPLESEEVSASEHEGIENDEDAENELEQDAGVGDQHAAPAEEPVREEEPVSLPEAAVGQDDDEAARSLSVEAEKKRQRETERAVREYLRAEADKLIREYAESERGIEVREVAGGYRMGTKPEYHDAVRGFVKSLKPPLKLTLQALETLAVVAYKQPVTAAEISEIRGVDSGGVLGGLMSRKLIATAGRKQVVGRPMLYKTTKDFLLRFGLKDIGELPSMEEFERMASELEEQEDLPMEQTEVDAMVEHANARGDAEHIAGETAVEAQPDGAGESVDDPDEVVLPVADPADPTGEKMPEGGDSSEPLNDFLKEAAE